MISRTSSTVQAGLQAGYENAVEGLTGDMAGQVETLAPQEDADAPNNREEPRKVFAALPPNASPELKKNTIYLDDPSLVWPNVVLQRHKDVQELFNRFHSQILYGCGDLNCRTRTCRSRQERISKGPFRPYTHLSACALANNLILQDDSESYFCPNNPSHRSEIRVQDDLLRTIEEYEGVSQIYSQPPKRKDQKSFTQFLYDTLPWKLFQGMKTADGFSQWAPWRNRHEQRTQDDESHNSHVTSSCHSGDRNGGSQPQGAEDLQHDSENMDATQTVLSPQMLHQLFGMDRTDNATDRIDNEEFPRHTSGLNSTLPKEVRTWGQMKSWAVENALDTPQELLIKLVNINLVENAIYQCQTGLPALRHENGSIAQVPPQIWSIAEALKSGRQQTSYLPLVPSYATPPNTTSTSNPDSLRDRQSEAQPTLSPDSRQFTSFSETTKRLTDWPKHLPDGYTGNDLSKSGSMNVKPPQTLSHFTPDNIKELLRIMADIPAFQKAFYLNNTFGRTQSMVRLSQPFRAPSTSETTMAFVLQSIIYVMSSCRPLLRSFRSPNAKKNVSPTQYSLPFNTMTYAMKALIELELHPPNVIPCLCRTTAHLFARLPHGNYIRHKPGSRQAGEVKQETWHFRTETQVAHILKISLAALTALIPDCQLKVWELVQRSHAHGLIVPRSSELHDNRVEIDSLHAVMSSFENDMALNLVKQLVNAIASRLRVVHLHEGQYSVMDLIIRSLVNTVPPVTFRSGRFGRLEFSYRNVGDSDNSNDTRNGEDNSNDEGNPNDSPSYGSMVYEWLRRLLLKEWDGNVEIRKSSTVASVLEVMSFFYDHHWKLRIHPDSFHTYYFSDRLDSMEMPVQWMSSQSKPNTVHLLEYHFFFPRSALVTYFRAINFSTMREAYEETARNSRMLAQMSYCGEIRLPERFEYLLKSYFVMDIRRENMLQDTFNQLWMRNRKELFKPLKVRMGMDEGEEGVDHGGVQQEYYRFAVAQFLDPDYGLFTRDEISHTSWFHPCPLEPLWKMELIGILFGLGVYNGVTLPISFPRAFYCKLLRPDKKFKLDDIKDGWPVLAKGLQDLLNWTDGDVKDVFARSYVFSADVERLVAVDMKRIKREDEWQHCWWCDRPPRDGNGGGNEPEPEPEPDPEPEMVTNANRKEYVADYIFWLTDKSIRPQFAAFLKGFHVCVPPKALSIFSPDDLQELMEGVREIDVADLKAVARLEGGFAEFDEVVQNFWAVVREFDQEQLRMLLQFVTASDRLPADGVDKLAFSVQKNGEGDERLPTSLTCFGRLLLPAYSSKEKLREKLCVAIENSKGFGTP